MLRALLTYTVTVCFAMVLLLLEGKRSFMALGATRVDVSMKNIKSKKTKSDMEAMLKLVSRLLRICIAIISPFI
jgi:hypothetical protein